MLLVSIHKWILSDGTCNVITVCLAYESACLATPLCLRAIDIHWWLLCIWSRFMTKFSLVRQFEIFSMVSWAVAYTWGHTPYDIQIFPYPLQTAKPHYVECSARSLRNSRPVDNAYPKLTVAQQHLHTILCVEVEGQP